MFTSKTSLPGKLKVEKLFKFAVIRREKWTPIEHQRCKCICISLLWLQRQFLPTKLL